MGSSSGTVAHERRPHISDTDAFPGNTENTSLVFGEDPSGKTNSANEAHSESTLTSEKVVRMNRQFSLVDKPEDTPFLQRLRDPFESSVAMSASLFEANEIVAQFDSTHDITKCHQKELLLLQLSPWNQRDLENSEKRAPIADTQVISTVTADENRGTVHQVILADTQQIASDTQRIDVGIQRVASATQIIEKGQVVPTQKIDIAKNQEYDHLQLSPQGKLLVRDNGVVVVPNPAISLGRVAMGPTQMDAGPSSSTGDVSQSMDTPTQLRLTQKINITSMAEPTDIFDTLGYQPDANDSLGQIRFLASHREVPNTQDSVLDARPDLGPIALEEDIEIVSDDEANNTIIKYTNGATQDIHVPYNADTQKILLTQKSTLVPHSDQPHILGLGSPTVISDSSPTAAKHLGPGSNRTSEIPDTSNTQALKLASLPPSSPTLKRPFTSGESAKLDLCLSNDNIDFEFSTTRSLEIGKAKLEKTLTDDQDEVVIPSSHQRKHKFVIDSQNEEGLRLYKRPRGDKDEIPMQIELRNLPHLLREELLSVLTERDIVFKGGVWALYNLRVYSGILLNLGDEILEVEFEEGTYQIKNEDLHLLDIRIGDTIRVKSKVAKFTVTGLKKTLNDNLNGNSICCVRGYDSVLLKRQNTKAKSFSEIEVPLAECWMEIGDLMKHQQGNAMLIKGKTRSQFESFGELCDEIAGTDPSVSIANAVASSPMADPESSPLKGQKSKSSPIKSLRTEETKLFSGRLFIITSVSGNKQALCDVILRNGGAILEGFEKYLRCIVDDGGIRITIDGQFAHYRFACVVSTSYCRSAKYLQALALGWPVVSDAYIFDSIRNANNLESWCAYLLPSGKSKYLGDAVKSMDIYPFRKNYENECTLDEQLCLNSNLLVGINVLILKQNMSNMVLETAVFIFHAFGAKTLNYIVDVGEISSTIANIKEAEGSGNKILVFEVGTTVRKSVENSFDVPEPARITRSRSGIAQKLAAIEQNVAKVGFVDWEWLVQCVISTHIWEPDYFNV